MQTLPVEKSRNVAQWFDAWLMEPAMFEHLAQRVQMTDIPAHLAASPSPVSSGSYVTKQGSTAIVEISGVLMKSRSSMMEGASTVELRRELKALQRDGSVERVLLHIESPGGTAAGTMELADAVRDLAAVKPVEAFIEDIGASAAYWVASQADHIYANKMAKVGSIGTYAVVTDMSGAAAQRGIKVHVVRAGEFKGMGTPGTEITASQLAEVQRIIDGANAEFLQAVANGRGLSLDEVTQLADGRVHRASDAVEMRLVDEIATFEAIANRSQLNTFRRSEKMATAKEIQAACPGISPETTLRFLTEDKSLADCVTAHMQDLATDCEALNEELIARDVTIKELSAEISELKSQLAAVKTAPGLEPLEEAFDGNTSGESARAEWSRRIEEKRQNGMSSTEAAVAVNRDFPGLRERMVEEVNS